MKAIKYPALISIVLFLVNPIKAQNLIAVQNGSRVNFFQQVDDAITNAFDGDTIYIPGGSWNISKPIDKRLFVIGVGYHTDSTNVTFPTNLNGSVTLMGNASCGLLSGVQLNGAISNNSHDTIRNYSISRCRITGGLSFTPTSINFLFCENIIGGAINGLAARNFSFFNNLLYITQENGNVDIQFENSTFENNIFSLDVTCYHLTDCYSQIACQYSIFKNNVFLSVYGNLLNIINSIFKNNLFVENISFPVFTNVGSGNIVNNNIDSIFKFIEYPTSLYNYSFSNNYHLIETCPGKNAGTDGTDIGIYGGTFPWKDGSIPFNPHFQKAIIGTTTDGDGNLNVQIKVAAQDR
jgi:hypothetical protein